MEYREIRDDEGEYSETVEPCISSSHFMSSMLSEVVRLDSIDSFPFVCRYETQNIHERLLNESCRAIHFSHVELVNILSNNEVVTTIKAKWDVTPFLQNLFHIGRTTGDAFLFCTICRGAFVGMLTVHSLNTPMIVVKNITDSITYAYSVPNSPNTHYMFKRKDYSLLDSAYGFAVYFRNSDTRFVISKTADNLKEMECCTNGNSREMESKTNTNAKEVMKQLIHETDYGFCSEFTDTQEFLSYRMGEMSHPIHWLPCSFRSYFFRSLHSDVLHTDIKADYIIINSRKAKYMSNYRVRNRHLEKHGLAAVYPKENEKYRSYPSKLLFIEGDEEPALNDTKRILKSFESEESMKENCDHGRTYNGGYENSFSTLYRWRGKGTIRVSHKGKQVKEIFGTWKQGVLEEGVGYEPEGGDGQEYCWIQLSYGLDELSQEDIRGTFCWDPKDIQGTTARKDPKDIREAFDGKNEEGIRETLKEKKWDSLLFWGKMRNSHRVREVLSPYSVIEEFGKILCDACRNDIVEFFHNCMMERRMGEETTSNEVTEEVIREYLTPTRMVEYVLEMMSGAEMESEDAERLYFWLWDMARPAFRKRIVDTFTKSFADALQVIPKQYRDQITDELVKDAIKQLVMKTAQELMKCFHALDVQRLFSLLNDLLTPERMLNKKQRMKSIMGVIFQYSANLDDAILCTDTVFDLLEEYHSTLDDLQALTTNEWNDMKKKFESILKTPIPISSLIGNMWEVSAQSTVLSSIKLQTELATSIRNVLLCCSFLDPTSLRVYDLEHLERISFGPQSMGNCEDVSIFNLPSLKTIHFYDHSLQDCKKVIINSRVR